MKVITKKLIACILVVIMAFSMVSVAAASTPSGGINDFHYAGFDFNNGGWRLDVYLSDSFIKSFFDAYQAYGDFNAAYSDVSFLLNPTPKSMAMKIVNNYDSLKFLDNPLIKLALDLTSPEAFLKSFAKKLLKENIAAVGNTNRGNGVIIKVYLPAFGATVESQSGPTAPVAERVQIAVTASPSEGGKTAGGGSILKYVATANNRLTRIQLNAYPNSGWQFDGWYEGGTKVGSNTTLSFDAERNRTLEARFKRSGSSGSSTSQLTVKNSVDGEYIVTIPANYTLDCFKTPTATTRYTHVTARTSSYQIHCTKRLTMSDGSTRYFFISGNNNECYFVFTNSMRVEEKSTSVTAPESAAKLQAPTNVRSDKTQYTTTDRIIVSWNAVSGATYYWVNLNPVKGGGGGGYRADGASLTLYELNEGDYDVSVQAVNAEGYSLESQRCRFNVIKSDGTTVITPGMATIIYNANGGSGVPTGTNIKKDQNGYISFTLSTTKPTRDGYSFQGWRRYDDLGYSIYNPGQSISLSTDSVIKDETIYFFAEWIEATTNPTKTVQRVELASTPNKMSYISGERFDPTGMSLKVSYNDGSNELTTTGFTYQPEILTTPQGTLSVDTVAVSYGGVVISLVVSVSNQIGRVELVSGPTKYSYTAGERFDPTGACLRIHYEDGTTTLVNGSNITFTVVYVNSTPQSYPINSSTVLKNTRTDGLSSNYLCELSYINEKWEGQFGFTVR